MGTGTPATNDVRAGQALSQPWRLKGFSWRTFFANFGLKFCTGPGMGVPHRAKEAPEKKNEELNLRPFELNTTIETVRNKR